MPVIVFVGDVKPGENGIEIDIGTRIRVLAEDN